MKHSPYARPVTFACLTALFVAMLAAARGGLAADSSATPSVRPLISQGSMNVYRRFPPEHRAQMIDFYSRVLALRPLQPIDLGGGARMILFGIGSGQIKLATGMKEGRQYHLGGVNEATGIRLITFFFPDEAALVARFQALGYPAPEFRENGDGTRAALVQDPGGFTLQLVIVPDAPAAAYAKVEVGINVSDLQQSRAFYRDFVGLDELPPVTDALLGVTKYPYRHGETTLNLWSAGKDLPADTGSAGIQYVVSDVDLVDARAQARNVVVEQALGDMPGFALRTVWLNDPDGVTNYFAQVGARGSAAKATAPVAPAAGCDRACLDGMVDRYIEALLAHDPTQIPTTPNVRFIENGVELPLGSALWRTASGRGTYSHYFADVAAGQAGFIGTLREHGKGLILVLRLAVGGGRISEIEQLAIRAGRVEEYEQMKPDPLWSALVPEQARIPRDQLIALADRYYTGMQRNDPKGDYSFFHKDCNRIEHGRQTTNMPPSNYGHSDIANFVTMGCEAQFQTGFLGFVTTIRERRYPVVDEERQAVLAFAFFDHDGSIRSIPLSTGQTFIVPPYFSTPRTLMIAEGFKVADRKLRLIEAALTESPYGMRSVLDNPPAAAPRTAATRQCDRKCARSLIDGVLAAMIARDPTQAPLSRNVRYTENGQPLTIGDGLWRTLTARGSYNIYLAADSGSDPALFGSIVETDIPGQLSLRVRQREGRITEIEALVVRQEIPMLGQLIGTGTLMAPPQLANFDSVRFRRPEPALMAPIPPAARTPAAKLRQLGADYVQAAYAGAGEVPFAERCTMRENGVASVDNMSIAPLEHSNPPFHPFGLSCRQQIDSGFFPQVGRLRGQRVLAVDASQGLVLIAATIDHPGDVETVRLKQGDAIALPEAFRPPSSYLRAVLIKVRDGRIHHVEVITRPVFYGLGDGWEG